MIEYGGHKKVEGFKTQKTTKNKIVGKKSIKNFSYALINVYFLDISSSEISPKSVSGQRGQNWNYKIFGGFFRYRKGGRGDT